MSWWNESERCQMQRTERVLGVCSKVNKRQIVNNVKELLLKSFLACYKYIAGGETRWLQTGEGVPSPFCFWEVGL